MAKRISKRSASRKNIAPIAKGDASVTAHAAKRERGAGGTKTAKRGKAKDPESKVRPRSERNGATSAAPPRLLAGGNPQIAKADGDAAVQAYIAAMPGWKRDAGQLLDLLIMRAVPASPGVRKAVKWNSPFYGVEGDPQNGWFLSFHCFAKYVKVAFFRGTSLRPVPPGESKQKEVRYLDVYEEDLARFNEARFGRWVKQASELPGERM